MKRIFAFIAAAMLVTFAVSCQPTEEGGGQASLTAEPSALSFESTGAAAQTVKVTATGGVEWEYEVPQIVKEWLTVSRDGDVLTASVTDNLKGEQRNAIVTLRATNNGDIKERTISVSQEANPNPVEFSISVEPAYMSFVGTEAPAQDVTVTVSGGMTWEATTDVDWITITPTEGKFGVSVTDNPDGKQREGTITVTPSDSEVDPATVRVVQDGKKEFTLSNEDTGEIPETVNFTMDSSQFKIDIVASNVSWDAEIVDEKGNTPEWCWLGFSESYVNVVASKNGLTDERKATVIITTDWEEVPEVRINIVQAGAPDHLSTFTGNIDFTTEDFPLVQARVTPWQKSETGGVNEEWQKRYERSAVDLYFISNAGGTNEGYVMKMQLMCERIEWNAESYFEISDAQPYVFKEFNVTTDVETGMSTVQDMYTINIGKAGGMWNPYSNAWLLDYEGGAVVGSAPLREGELVVTHNGGDNYTFNLNVKDDFNNVFTIDWTGDIVWRPSGQMEPEE